MAEIPKINDIASQLSTASRVVVTTDFFWIYTGNGSQVKIPAEFVRAYLTNGIIPTIDENGNWLIGGKETGVKAEGVTPKLRATTLGVEVSYDKGATWQTCFLYSELDPDLQPLIDAYEQITKSEAGRVEAETLRVEAETTRKNAWTAWFEDTTNGVKALWDKWFATTKQAWADWFGASESAGVRKTWTDWFNSIKKAWSEFNTAANDTETLRVNAETLRSQAETARDNAENIRRNQEANRVSAEQTRASQEDARKSAETARANAENTRVSQESSRVTAESNRVNAEELRVTQFAEIVSDASRATAAANTAATKADNQTAKCKSATDLAEELNAHPQMQGENGNWWKWNTETNEYEDTGIIARGGGMYPMVRSRRNHIIWYDSTDGFKERIVRRRNHTVIKL